NRAEFIIIGSGPAGVSAALPLVEAGRTVLMLDGADSRDRTAFAPGERGLGSSLEGLSLEDGLSPKLRAPEARRAMSAFTAVNKVVGENFVVAGAIARGGLSRLWGGFAAEFDAGDLSGWPISHAELSPSYARISARIGVSGVTDDAAGRLLGASGPLQAPLALGAASSAVLARYRQGEASELA